MIRTAIIVIAEQPQQPESQSMISANSCLNIIRQMLAKGPFVEVDCQILPKEQAMLRSRLRVWTDVNPVDLILSTGGTGLDPKDRSPEAVLEVIEKPLEGMVELMRLMVINKDRTGALLRLAAGFRRQSIIITLPDQPQQVQYALGAILEIIPEALKCLGVMVTSEG
ncbi:MAG: molybdopterin-binding protein [Deinococcales bacterium]